jgi:hypothetical protein
VIRIDLMLADYATVQGGKLFISGAGIHKLGASLTADLYTVNFALALIMKIPGSQSGKDHELVVSITDSAGKDVLQDPRSHDIRTVGPEKIIANFNLRPSEPIGDQEEFAVPLAFLLYGLKFPHEGTYTLRAEIDGVTKSYAQFQVIAPPQRLPRPPVSVTGRIEATNCDTGVKFSGSGTYDLPDLRIISRGNRIGIDVDDDTDVRDYGTIIE